MEAPPVIPGMEVYSQISPGLTAAYSPFPANMPLPYVGMGDASAVFGRIPVTAAGLNAPQVGIPTGVQESEAAGLFGTGVPSLKKPAVLAVLAAVVLAVIAAIIAAIVAAIGVIFVVGKPGKNKDKEEYIPYPYPEEYPEEYPPEYDTKLDKIDGKPYPVPKAARSRQRRNVPAPKATPNTSMPTMTLDQLNAITRVVASALHSQECLQRLICESNELARSLPGFDIVSPMVSMFMPAQYRSIMEEKPACDTFACGSLTTRK